MSISEFEKQMKYLADNNYQCLSMEDVEAYYHGKKEVSKKSCMFNFLMMDIKTLTLLLNLL